MRRWTCHCPLWQPHDKNGLGSDQCRPACACEGLDFAPPSYDAAFMQALIDNWQLATPYRLWLLILCLARGAGRSGRDRSARFCRRATRSEASPLHAGDLSSKMRHTPQGRRSRTSPLRPTARRSSTSPSTCARTTSRGPCDPAGWLTTPTAEMPISTASRTSGSICLAAQVMGLRHLEHQQAMHVCLHLELQRSPQSADGSIIRAFSATRTRAGRCSSRSRTHASEHRSRTDLSICGEVHPIVHSYP